MLEVHAILQRQRCNENITKKTGTLSDAYKEKDFDFERELCDWLMSNELIYKFPPYEGIPCCKIGDILLSKNTSDSIKLKRDLLEQFIAYLSTFNEIPDYV